MFILRSSAIKFFDSRQMGEAVLPTARVFCLQLNFFAYSPLRCLLNALSLCKQESLNCKQTFSANYVLDSFAHNKGQTPKMANMLGRPPLHVLNLLAPWDLSFSSFSSDKGRKRSIALVAPYCAIPRDYLSDTPLLRAMGFLVSQHGQLGAIPPPPFLRVSPPGEHPKWRCDTHPQKGYLGDTCAIPYENKANGCDTPLCDTISKGYCAIWGGYLALGR